MIPNNLLIRLLMRLAQTKAGNNSSTFKNESYYQNCLQQFTHVIIILEQKKVVTREPKTFYFDWP